MITTLFAHEARTTWKRLLGLSGIVLLVVALGLAAGALKIPILGGLGFVLALLATIMIVPVMFVLLAENYWRTMYGREGYFTMTLPVRGRTVFTAKVLYALVVTYFMAAVTALVLLGISVVFSVVNGGAPLDFVRSMVAEAETAMIWFIVCSVLVQFTFTVITGAAMMSLGAEERFNHMGFGAPVVGYILLYVVMQVLGLAAMLLIPFSLVILGPDAGTFVAQGMLDDFIASIRGIEGREQPSVLGLGILPLTIIVTALFAWWGGRSVERRTSLR